MAHISFFPLGNADTTLIRMADNRLALFDYADRRNPQDQYDLRCDLPAELRKELNDAEQDDFAVVCFTHLDDDHVCGAEEFFWLEHAKKYQVEGRPKIKELWVPAAAITEEGAEDSARVVRQEARHRLIAGCGIKVFSRPVALEKFLEDHNLSLESRAHCIVDAGEIIPGFSKTGSEQVEFFVHCPFAWRRDDRGLEDRNQDSVVLHATFQEAGEETFALLGADVDHETLSKIVQTTKRHDREERLLWDVLKLFHHCSYKSLGPERGEEETVPEVNVQWLIENRGREGAIIVSPSKPIPTRGSEADDDCQPPHRQAASYYKRIMEDKDGEFRVTMETPSKSKPKPFRVEITAAGAKVVVSLPTAVATITSTPARAG